MKQLLKSICTYQRSPMTTNSNGTGAQNALTVTSQMTFHMQMGGASIRKEYKKPEVALIDVGPIMDNSLSTSDNTLHNSDTQTDNRGPGTGGDEEHNGGDDLDGAKSWQWVDDPSY